MADNLDWKAAREWASHELHYRDRLVSIQIEANDNNLARAHLAMAKLIQEMANRIEDTDHNIRCAKRRIGHDIVLCECGRDDLLARAKEITDG